MKNSIKLAVFLLSGLTLVFSACGPVDGNMPAGDNVLILDKPVELESQPTPGLNVVYTKIKKKVRDVDSMRSDRSMLRSGNKGKPLAKLDHAFGEGNVFDSGQSWFVGVLITGLIKLDQPGLYEFQALANDGIKIYVADQLVSADGQWHAKGDRLSPPGSLKVAKPGWYNFKIKYFQRKGTATLRMYWKRPGQEDFSVIPAEAYAHN